MILPLCHRCHLTLSCLLLLSACTPQHHPRHDFADDTPVTYSSLDGMGESDRRTLPKGQARVLLEILRRPAVRIDKSDHGDPDGRPLGFIYVGGHCFARFEGYVEQRLGKRAYLAWYDPRLESFPRLRVPRRQPVPLEASARFEVQDSTRH